LGRARRAADAGRRHTTRSGRSRTSRPVTADEHGHRTETKQGVPYRTALALGLGLAIAAAAGVGLCARGSLLSLPGGTPPGQKPEPSHARNAGAVLPFDSGRAFEHVRQLVAIGPRPAGSAGIEAARRYIRAQITAIGLSTTERAFEAQTPVGPLTMVNLSVVVPGARPERLVIGGHYDTKLFRRFRFVGANDGGSSAALLLELARVLKDRRNPFTIELVFFDGEEAVLEWTGTDHTYGSRQYVETARASATLNTIGAMLLVDMVGDRNLNIRRESNSTRWLTDIIWAAAGRLGHGDVFLDEPLAVEDDHVPFLAAGVAAVDIIDLDYPAWHTADDTLENVSARSLQTVGDVLLAALPQIEAALRRQ
jgi:glutaminyl-peptide cyclotransferase